MVSIAACGRLTSLWRVQTVDTLEGSDSVQLVDTESLDCSSNKLTPISSSAYTFNFGVATVIDVYLPDIVRSLLLDCLWSWFVDRVNDIDTPAAFANAIALSAPVDGGPTISYGALGMPDAGGAVQSGSSPTAAGLLVQFAADATVEEKAAALASAGVKIIDTVRAGDGHTGDLVSVDLNGHAADAVMMALSGAPGVSFAEVNWSLGVQAISNDSYYTSGSMWGMYGDKTSPANAYGSQAGEAWAAGYTGKSTIVVGDIDTGIDYTHPDLYLNVWLNQGELPKAMALVDYDGDGLITFRDLNQSVNSAFVTDLNGNGRIDAGDLLKDTRWADRLDQNGNGYIDDLIGWDFVNNDNDPYDDNGHGTHTAGTIGAMGANGAGVAGVNWNVEIMALKFLDGSGSGSLSNAIKAIDYYTAASAADQAQKWTSEFIGTNNSWGGGGYSQSMLDAIVRGANQDVLFIAAAGNGGSDGRGDNNNSVANYPSNYSTLSGAGYEAVIAVAALTNSGSIASYSNYGSQTVDLGAPGSNIWSTVPGGYASYSGTSMATPHVTGALALYASLHPDFTAAQLRDALLSSAVATSSLTNKTVTGGRLDISTFAGSGSSPTPSQSLPDLTAANLALNAAGTDVIFQFSNIGAADAANPAAGVYLSADSAITTADTALGSAAAPSLAASASISESAFVVLSAQASAGTYYLGVVVDPAGVIPEANELNNVSNTLPIILGTNGADSLNGTMTGDTILGFGGDNTINGGAGVDAMRGGSDNDTYFVDQQADLVFEVVGGGTDLVISTAPGFYLYANIEDLTLAAGFGNNFGVGNTLNNTIIGNEGINTLLGGDGNDTLDGGDGADAIYGEIGNDTLYGGTGFQTDILVGGDGDDMIDGSANPATGQVRNQGDYDLMYGGAGNETYFVDTPADLTFEDPGAAGGTDTVFADIVGAGYYLYANVENLTLLGATPFGVGNDLNNILIGNSGANWLLGGLGNDTLNGGSGNDVLFGEGEADTFQFNAANGQDLIADFQDGVDTINLQGTIFANFAQLAAAGALFDNGGSAVLNLSGGNFVLIQGVVVANLTAADFTFA